MRRHILTTCWLLLLAGCAHVPGIDRALLADRTPAAGTQEQFGKLIEAWVATGAACPAS